MTYKISNDRKTLTLFVDVAERAGLKSLDPTEIQRDETMQEWCGEMLCNSELEWIPEGTTGDLTSAPMLGIYKAAPKESTEEMVVEERWAFMDYQVRSVLEDLRDKGEAVFIS